MKKMLFYLPVLCLLLACFSFQPVLAAPKDQDAETVCGQSLLEAAALAGVPGEIDDFFEYDENNFSCSVKFQSVQPLVDEYGNELEYDQMVVMEISEGNYDTFLCGSGESDCKNVPFHGYSAARKNGTSQVHFNWIAEKGDLAYTYQITFYHTGWQELGLPYMEEQAMFVADALWQTSDSRLPVSASSTTPPNQTDGLPPSAPDSSGEQPGPSSDVPSGPSSSNDQSSSAIPTFILIGSLGVPLAGALLGSAFAAITSIISSSKTAPVPNSSLGNPISGLTIPIAPIDISTSTDQVPLSYADTSGAEEVMLDNGVDAHNYDIEFQGFKNDLAGMSKDLGEKGFYVLNPYQADWTTLGHRAVTGLNLLADNLPPAWRVGGQVKGLTCQGYVEQTSQSVLQSLQQHFPDGKIESIVFEEKSSEPTSEGFANWLDRVWYEENHNLMKVTLPDGSEWAVDFHQEKAGNASLLRPWDEARREWRDRLGRKEFKERVSYTLGGTK